jgi:hypothetical protein
MVIVQNHGVSRRNVPNESIYDSTWPLEIALPRDTIFRPYRKQNNERVLFINEKYRGSSKDGDPQIDRLWKNNDLHSGSLLRFSAITSFVTSDSHLRRVTSVASADCE